MKKIEIKNLLIEFSDFIQSLLFLGSIVNAIMAPVIKNLDKSKLPECLVIYSDFFSIFSFTYILNCVILTLFVVKLVITLINSNKKNNHKLIDFVARLHRDYIHDMRNHIYALEKTKKEILNIDIQERSKEYEQLYNAEFRILENVAQKCVDQISDIINEYMGMPGDGKSSICTCIKMVSVFESEEEISQRSLTTLARSKNTSNKRKQSMAKNIVGQNTDFLDLSKGYRNFFYGVDLKNKFKKGEYNNSTPNFSYDSTIVVPIRFADSASEVSVLPSYNYKKKRKVEIKIKRDVDIVGYLCIDTEKKLHEWEDYDEVVKVVKILSIYADSLYVYLRSFQQTFALKMED